MIILCSAALNLDLKPIKKEQIKKTTQLPKERSVQRNKIVFAVKSKYLTYIFFQI